MIKNITKRTICLILIIASLSLMIGCDKKEKEKELVISNNIQQDIKNKESKEFKVEKLKEFTIDTKGLIPIYWNNDGNIVAINSNRSSETQTINLYNINMDTGKTTIKTTLKDVIFLQSLNGSSSNKLFYTKDFKLWMYDLSNDNITEVYNLSDLKNELKPDNFNTLTMATSYGLVKGAEKYLYISCTYKKDGSSYGILNLLNLETKEIAKGKPTNSFCFNWDIVYSKIKDSFYVSGFNQKNTCVYEFKLNDISNIKQISKLKDLNLNSISDDGKEITLTKGFIDPNATACISKYDLINDKLTDVIIKKSSDNFAFYSGGYLYKNNILTYSECNGTGAGSKKETFICSYEDNKVSNIQKLSQNQSADYFTIGNLLFADNKANKFIFIEYYWTMDSFDYKYTKFYIYDIKNN